MKDFVASNLLEDALKVAKTSAVKNKNVKRLLNGILCATMEYQNDVGGKIADEIYKILDSLDYYGRSKGAEPYNN
jgi:hypothetical protein